MPGILYLVPSPIGNLNEVSPRVKEVLNSVDFVACEDTRNTSKLLELIGIKKRCFSCHEHNEKEASNKIINDLLDGKNVAYMSDAGYPCISDPGAILAHLAIEQNIVVTPLSGPNAFLNALVASDIDASHFLFYGFLDAKESQRVKELESLKDLPYTVIFYEAPHRINSTLKSMYEVLGNRKVTVARELTKKFEEFIRSDLETLVNENREFKGELVVVVDKNNNQNTNSLDKLLDDIDALTKKGLSTKDAILAVSILNKENKNKLYKEYTNKFSD